MTCIDGIFDSCPNIQAQNYVDSHYYYPVVTGGSFSTKSITAGRTYYLGPFVAKENTVITRLGLNVTTGSGVGGDTAIMGIYSYKDSLPYQLRGTNDAEVPIDAIAEVEATVSIPLVQGQLYFIAVNFENTCTVAAFANSNNVRDSGIADDSSTTLIKETIAYASTFPATSAAVVGDYTSESLPHLWFRKV